MEGGDGSKDRSTDVTEALASVLQEVDVLEDADLAIAKGGC